VITTVTDRLLDQLKSLNEYGDETLVAKFNLPEDLDEFDVTEEELGASQFCKNTGMRSPMAKRRE
jgi:hypothetical protein